MLDCKEKQFAELWIKSHRLIQSKTIQIIGATYKLFRQRKIKKALIVCPSTLKYQWAEEIEKFVDMAEHKIEYVVIDGTPKKRVESYDYVANNDVLFTLINYELIINDIEYLLEQDWDIVALDESHRIKNWQSKTSESIMKLNGAQYKWAATGTPVQNRPDEIFNIFRFVDEDVLGQWWKFRSKYIIIVTKFRQPNMILGFKNLGDLHTRLSPYMLRRLKKDVAPELPEMLINNYYIDMYKEQANLHETLRSDIIDLIKEVSSSTERDENGNVISQHPRANQTLGMFTMLQEVCDAPELLQMSDSGLAKRYAINKNKSPKLDELVNILKDFLASHDENAVAEKYKGLGPKAVIFTQFARMQELIVDKVSSLGECRVINGKMSAPEKQAAAVEFKMDEKIRFLVCTDAANYGLTERFSPYTANCWKPLRAYRATA
jgi:SNF2 family DNA or RNA helicase